MDVTHGETDANSLQTPQILRSRGLRRPIKLLHYRDTPAIRGGPEPKEAVMNVRFLALAAFFAVPVVAVAGSRLISSMGNKSARQSRDRAGQLLRGRRQRLR